VSQASDTAFLEHLGILNHVPEKGGKRRALRQRKWFHEVGEAAGTDKLHVGVAIPIVEATPDFSECGAKKMPLATTTVGVGPTNLILVLHVLLWL